MSLEEAKFAIAPYAEKIATFSTAQEIREFLGAEEVQGLCRNPYGCAIAEYIKRGSGHRVGVGFGFSGVAAVDRSGETIGRILHLTSAMEEFITNFDKGDYPELVK